MSSNVNLNQSLLKAVILDLVDDGKVNGSSSWGSLDKKYNSQKSQDTYLGNLFSLFSANQPATSESTKLKSIWEDLGLSLNSKVIETSAPNHVTSDIERNEDGSVKSEFILNKNAVPLTGRAGIEFDQDQIALLIGEAAYDKGAQIKTLSTSKIYNKDGSYEVETAYDIDASNAKDYMNFVGDNSDEVSTITKYYDTNGELTSTNAHREDGSLLYKYETYTMKGNNIQGLPTSLEMHIVNSRTEYDANGNPLKTDYLDKNGDIVVVTDPDENMVYSIKKGFWTDTTRDCSDYTYSKEYKNDYNGQDSTKAFNSSDGSVAYTEITTHSGKRGEYETIYTASNGGQKTVSSSRDEGYSSTQNDLWKYNML